MWVLFICLIPTVILWAQAQETSDNFQKHTISAQGINASYISYGATLTNLFVPDQDGTFRDVVLGYDQGSQYLNDTEHAHTYFGATVGRYAGRMKNASFTLDGVTYNVSANENGGADSLHGGKVGYDQRNWTLVSSNETSITFMLFDDAFEGYPGRVVTYATFSVGSGSSLTSRLISIPLDAPTPIMLTTHPYFNLDAFANPSDPTILGHTLYLPYSTRYVEVDNIEVPTGQIGTVTASDADSALLDFTSPRTLGSSINADIHQCGFNCTGIDTNFIIDRPPSSGATSSSFPVLSLSSNVTGIKFDLFTNQQALIVYTCNKLNGSIPLKQNQQHAPDGGTVYADMHGCVAIETQGWIDGVNYPEWGQQSYQIYDNSTEPAVLWTKYEFGLV